MYEGLAACDPVFLVPARPTAEELLPLDLADKKDALNYILHVVIHNSMRGIDLDYDRIDYVVGGRALRIRLINLLTEKGVIEPVPVRRPHGGWKRGPRRGRRGARQ